MSIHRQVIICPTCGSDVYRVNTTRKRPTPGVVRIQYCTCGGCEHTFKIVWDRVNGDDSDDQTPKSEKKVNVRTTL